MSHPDESAISRLLEESRRHLDRVEAADLASAQTADDPDRRIVLVCNEGYSSSLAAHTLQRIGLAKATDLCGGYQAWLKLTRRERPPAV